MTIKTLLLFMLIFSSQGLYAKAKKEYDFLLKANETTSFMNYEFHNLAYEAATKKDYENAYRIYAKLANKGDARAEYNIGMMYMKGLGVERSKMDAYKWLRRASKHGNEEATLYFKQMHERYEAKAKEKEARLAEKEKKYKKAKEQKAKESVAVVVEKNSSSTPKKPQVKATPVVKPKPITPPQPVQEKSDNLLYIIIAFVAFMLILGFFFLKRSSTEEEKGDKPKKQAPVAQNSLAFKAQLFDITCAHVAEYHSALLKQVNMAQIKADPQKTQIYYMFIYGMIDYFCQLEKLSDSEQRRVFTTHMGQLEGKENLTAITKSILEGQKDASMYHYQAAGGISAQAWNEDKAADALSMLKKVLTEKRH